MWWCLCDDPKDVSHITRWKEVVHTQRQPAIAFNIDDIKGVSRACVGLQAVLHLGDSCFENETDC